jgi:hypothetical protein
MKVAIRSFEDLVQVRTRNEKDAVIYIKTVVYTLLFVIVRILHSEQLS